MFLPSGVPVPDRLHLSSVDPRMIGLAVIAADPPVRERFIYILLLPLGPTGGAVDQVVASPRHIGTAILSDCISHRFALTSVVPSSLVMVDVHPLCSRRCMSLS